MLCKLHVQHYRSKEKQPFAIIALPGKIVECFIYKGFQQGSKK